MKHFKLYAGALFSMLLLSTTSSLAVTNSGIDQKVEWQLQQNWPTGANSLDMVHSLDGKFVYILTDKNTVQIFNSKGQLQGTIPVESGVTAIDIAPVGEKLYLINNEKQTFSSISVSFIVDIDSMGSPFRGPADAPVTITLFTDFE